MILKRLVFVLLVVGSVGGVVLPLLGISYNSLLWLVIVVFSGLIIGILIEWT